MPKKDKEGKDSRRESTRRSSKKEKHSSDHDGGDHHSEKRRSTKHHHHEPPPEHPSPVPEEIELLSPKQNGSTGVEQQGNKASIKGMWKKAFKSLKSKDKEKEEKHEKPEKTEKSRLQRGASFLGFGGGSRDSGKSQSSQHDFHHQHQDPLSSPEVVQGIEPPQKESRFRRYSRQSSLKRVLKRKDSKEASSDGETSVEGATGGGGGQEQGGSFDPVFATLRNAMSMRKPSDRSLSGSEIDSLPTMLDTMPEEYDEYGTDPFNQGYSRYEDM